MSGTMREIVSALAAENNSQQQQQQQQQQEENDVIISLDIDDDKLFLLHFIIGTYFGPDLRKLHHHRKQSAFQIQASKKNLAGDELSGGDGSLMKRAELERVYHHILSNADPSLVLTPRKLRMYFNGKCSIDSNGDLPVFSDLYPRKLFPETRVQNKYKFIQNIVFINDPDTSCMRQDCLDRFKLLTGMESFKLSLSVDVTETNGNLEANEVEDESLLEPLEVPVTSGGEVSKGQDVTETNGNEVEDEPLEVPVTTSGVEESNAAAEEPCEVSKAEDVGLMVGLIDIGECDDAYLFRVSLPGVKRDERDFSCEVEDNGKVLVRGVTTTGEKRVHRYSQVFEMQTQNLCLPGHFSVSFHLPGPVYPHEFSGNFGTDGILEGIVKKKMQKQAL